MSSLEIWKTFGDRLRRFVRKSIRHDHDSDDVLQEVFTKIHAGLGGVEDPDQVEAWVFQVARRAVVDHFRRRRPSELPADVAEERPAEPGMTDVASCLPPMMETLPVADQEALRLADVEGLPQKDLAARLGLTLPGAKSRVQRARRRLKKTLLECCDVELDRRGNALSWQPRRPCAC